MIRYPKYSLLRLKEDSLFKSKSYLYFIWFSTFEEYIKFYNDKLYDNIKNIQYINIDLSDRILYLDKKRYHDKSYKFYIYVYKFFAKEKVFWLHLDLEKTFELLC